MKYLTRLLLFFLLASQMFPQWKQSELPVASDVWGLASKDSYIFAGTELGFQMPGYVFRSTNFGLTWDTVGVLPYAGGWSFVYNDPVLVAGSFGWGMYLSTDMGYTWTVPDSGMNPIENVHILIQHGHYLFAATAATGNGILRSSDNGRKWISVNEGLTTFSFLSLASNGLDIYAGTASTGEVFHSTDDGMTWFPAGNGLPANSSIASLAVRGSDVYAGMGSGQGVYYSSDSGSNWEKISQSLPVGQVWTLVLADTNLLVGTIGAGILLTSDNGKSWVQVNQGLTNLNIRSLMITDNKYLLAGTTNGFVCYRSLSDIITGIQRVNDVPPGYSLYQNYPNPFNPVTKIKYKIEERSLVKLSVYDVLGNEIETLVNGEKPAGTYEVLWNAGNHTSGVYFYRLRALPYGGRTADFVKTIKMIFLK